MIEGKHLQQKGRTVTTSCPYNCGGRCIVNVRISGGVVTGIGTDKRPHPSLKACVRGLAQRDVLYAKDRLTRPLKRTGPRGEGRFTPISWNEAMDTVSGKLAGTKDRYGPDAVLLIASAGSVGSLYGASRAAHRFFSMYGGATRFRGNMSFEGATFASRQTFGSVVDGSSPDNLLHSRLIILWGWNPVVTRFGPATAGYLAKVRKAGTKIVCVDPRQSPSARDLADQWVPIRPGTDAALLIAMAHVVISEGLHDRTFLEKYTHGFDAFADYVSGREDGVAKTPEWAEKITGVPAGIASQLAREYATNKPAALCAGWAPGRSAFGEQYHRAAMALSAMTGNIGIEGGNAGGGTGMVPQGLTGKTLPIPRSASPAVHVTEVYDAILQGKAGGYPSDIKLLYIVGTNFLNQFLNTNKGVRAMMTPEFIVAHELFLTPTARYADIVLPVRHFLETRDLVQPWIGGPYAILTDKAVEPLAETRTDLDIFSELAQRLGLAGYNDRAEEDWLREFVDGTRELPGWEEMKRKGVHEHGPERPWVAFREEIEDPEKHPFPTPSGKIEIFSENIAKMNTPGIPPIPRYIDPWEGPNDPRRDTYPLQLVSPHARTRVNSMFDNIGRLKRHAKNALWLNTADALSRGIADGDAVTVFNKRGRLLATAFVSARIMPGVASLDAGAWFRPDPDGLDRGGCANVLPRDEKSPGGAFPCNTCRVQVEKA
jgi:anaerobic dimethyl sulfoxide reductase subunit A